MSDRDPIAMSPREVAVISAGLAAGAWLARQGFEPVLFEVADDLGGQWNAASSMSGVWPGMRMDGRGAERRSHAGRTCRLPRAAGRAAGRTDAHHGPTLRTERGHGA